MFVVGRGSAPSWCSIQSPKVVEPRPHEDPGGGVPARTTGFSRNTPGLWVAVCAAHTHTVGVRVWLFCGYNKGKHDITGDISRPRSLSRVDGLTKETTPTTHKHTEETASQNLNSSEGLPEHAHLDGCVCVCVCGWAFCTQTLTWLDALSARLIAVSFKSSFSFSRQM